MKKRKKEKEPNEIYKKKKWKIKDNLQEKGAVVKHGIVIYFPVDIILWDCRTIIFCCNFFSALHFKVYIVKVTASHDIG